MADQGEDSTKLRFNADLESSDSTFLFLSEVQFLLENRKMKEEAEDGEANLKPEFLKTLKYAQKFGQFRKPQIASDVRALLASRGFHKFEQAALASLCPETADEAKHLIPSLQDRISDADLEEVLDEMRTLRGWTKSDMADK
eukprot:m.83877 g.83877  ORF g.83877 m.83877 type:complete len:142 (+) comp14994_c0_seq4:82-507(+)